jgi:hypothetical protein
MLAAALQPGLPQLYASTAALWLVVLVTWGLLLAMHKLSCMHVLVLAVSGVAGNTMNM